MNEETQDTNNALITFKWADNQDKSYVAQREVADVFKKTISKLGLCTFDASDDEELVLYISKQPIDAETVKRVMEITGKTV